MYNEMICTNMQIFDNETGDYIGAAHFELAPWEEKKLLELLNYGNVPQTLLLSNVEFIQSNDDYIPPDPFAKIRRKGVLNAVINDRYSGAHIPVEMQMKYTRMARSNRKGDPN